MNKQTFLITGATGGIGGRVSRRLLDDDKGVFAVVRNEDRFRELVHAWGVEDKSGSVKTCHVDFSNSQTTEACVASIESSEMSLAGLVLVYPSIPRSPETLPPANEWRDALNLCFVNPLSVLRAALDRIVDGGRVVVVSGISGVQVFPSLSFSNAIRAAWLAEAKTLSYALAKRGVRINVVSLGGTLTERFQERVAARNPNDIPPEDSPENIPLGSYADPDDVSKVICSLLGDFSNHITGANVVVDGGLTRVY